MPVARGNIIVRRKAKDGEPGAQGARVEFCTYTSGRAYCSGQPGESVYHIAFHATYQQFFRCKKSYPASETHAPTQSGSNSYWQWEEGIDQLIIDVLCANEAFLNNLTVRHMRTEDDKCQILTGGYLRAVDAYLTNVRLYGTSRCPFVEYDGSWTWEETSAAQLHDNLLMASTGIIPFPAGGFPWDATQNGRRVTITNYKVGSTVSNNYVTIPSPSPTTQFFFENGLAKTDLRILSREFVELLGIGEGNTFRGWLVLNRGRIESVGKYGKAQTTMAYGTIRYTGNGTSHSCSLVYKTYDGSAITAHCVTAVEGKYQINIPSAWGFSASDYMVMLTPYGRSNGGSSNQCIKATLIEQTTSYFIVETSDDQTNNWGGGFNFQIYNLAQWYDLST